MFCAPTHNTQHRVGLARRPMAAVRVIDEDDLTVEVAVGCVAAARVGELLLGAARPPKQLFKPRSKGDVCDR